MLRKIMERLTAINESVSSYVYVLSHNRFLAIFSFELCTFSLLVAAGYLLLFHAGLKSNCMEMKLTFWYYDGLSTAALVAAGLRGPALGLAGRLTVFHLVTHTYADD